MIGLNGAGKSTLLHIIAQTIRPSEGRVLTQGKLVALLELGSGFNVDFTGYENIRLTSKIYGLTTLQTEEIMADIVQFSGLKEEVLNDPVRTYSSGMVIRLAFSIIAFIDADIFLIDEAFAVGDIQFQSKCFNFLERQKKEGKTIVFVTHDMNFISRLCDRAILLHDGKIEYDGNVLNAINIFSGIINGFQNSFINRKKNVDDIDQSKELSYGDGSGKIYDVQTFDQNENEKKVFKSGSILVVKFSVTAIRLIKDPIYTIKIRDPKGQIMYGNNSKYMNLSTGNLASGEKVEIKYSMNLNLGVGKYLLSVGLTRLEDEELQVIHRKHDCSEVEVVAVDNSFGVSNCFADLEIKK